MESLKSELRQPLHFSRAILICMYLMSHQKIYNRRHTTTLYSIEFETINDQVASPHLQHRASPASSKNKIKPICLALGYFMTNRVKLPVFSPQSWAIGYPWQCTLIED